MTLNWSPFGSMFSNTLQILREKQVLKVKCAKLVAFLLFWEGASARGGACGNIEILRISIRFQHALLPLRGCGESLGFAPAAGPLCDQFC